MSWGAGENSGDLIMEEVMSSLAWLKEQPGGQTKPFILNRLKLSSLWFIWLSGVPSYEGGDASKLSEDDKAAEGFRQLCRRESLNVIMRKVSWYESICFSLFNFGLLKLDIELGLSEGEEEL